MQLTSIEDLYSKITRNNALQEELNELDVIEWVREALKKIDQYDQWIKKSYKLVIKDHRAFLPADFYSFDYEQGKPSGREQGNQFYTTQKSGIVVIHYLAFAVDNQGRPMIPASEEYMDAFHHYCVAHMCRKRVILPDEEINYTKEYQRWLQKKDEARADANLQKSNEIRDEVAINHNSFIVWGQPRPEGEDYKY